MSNFKKPFSKIKDISDRRRLPRLGKIRLGVKMVSRKTGKEYPKEVDYFVVPPEVEKIYGPAPKELDVMFPLNEIEAIFPQRLVWYGQSRGAKCIGDGERANRVAENGDIHEIECPCERYGKECQRRAHLLVLLPKVSLGGIYQIDLGSYHSIVDINSGLDYIQALVGRFSMVPLKLKRVPKETHGSGRKETHWPLMIHFEGDVNFINTLRESTNRILTSTQYLLPAPVEENPVMDAGAIVVEDEPEEKPDSKSNPIPTSDFPPPDNNLVEDVDVTPSPIVEEEVPPEDIAKELGGEVVDNDKLKALRKELASFESQADIIFWMSSEKVKGLKKQIGETAYLLLMEDVNKKLQEIVKKRTAKREGRPR